MINKEYGLVLSGGGTKGAYQIGTLKALKELGINIKAIAGVSIGALNGALFLQGDIDKAEKIYSNIRMKDIMNTPKIDEEKNIFDVANLVTLFSYYSKQKGLDNAPLRKTIENNLSIEDVYNSNIDFGIMTYSVNNKLPIEKFKDEIPKEQMVDYLLASAAFPFFKPQKVGEDECLDGGMYDNSPINMLIKRGYQNILVSDINGLGFSKKVLDKDVYIKVIHPSEDLGGSFEFNHDKIEKNITLGYLDTMKCFGKMQGHTYYFPQEEFSKMMEVFNLETIYGLENAAEVYKMDRYRTYTFEEFVDELDRKHRIAKIKYDAFKNDNILQLGKKFKNLFDGGLGICIAKDLYMDRPASKLSNYMLNFLRDYHVSARAILELENYLMIRNEER